MQTQARTGHHFFSVGFGIAVLLLVAILFLTFAIGAYLFFDAPTSNVIAITNHSQNSSSIMINATSLSPTSKVIIWVDPQVNYDNNGYPSSANLTSGFRIANATTSPFSTLNAVFPVSETTISQIEHDGYNVHSLWVILPNTSSTLAPPLMSVSQFSAQNFTTATEEGGLTFFITLYTFVIPLNFTLGSLFIVLWTIYIMLFAMALNGPFKNVIRTLKDTSKIGLSGLFENSIISTAIVFPLVLWSSVLLALLQQSVGVQTGSLPSSDPLLLFAELSIAPIREELGFRVIPIGIGAFFILLSQRRIRDALLSLWHPQKYLKKDLDPLTYKKRLRIMYVLGTLSALTFGLAHYLLGAGWGPGKITEAAIAGAALAILYYKYGLPATILLHWSIDYALTTYQLLPSLSVEYDIIIFYTLGIAITALIVLVYLLYQRMQSSKQTIPLTVGV